MRKNIYNEAFSDIMHELRRKLSSVMSYYDSAVKKGNDGFSVCRTRFDSIFVHLDQIMITIEDPTGPLYDRAHCCLDFVAQCLILHFGLLHLAIEDYDLTAYIPT